MTKIQSCITGYMTDFLSCLDLSEKYAPGSWVINWNPSDDSEDIRSFWFSPDVYHIIEKHIIKWQVLGIGESFVGAVYLRPGLDLEVEDKPLDLIDLLRKEKQLYYGFRYQNNVLYYLAVELDKPENRPEIVQRTRDVLDRLAAGKTVSDYRTFLPENRVVEIAAEKIGLQNVRSLHEEYYHDREDVHFSYISIKGKMLQPGISMQVFLFDRQESLNWLRNRSNYIPQDEQTKLGRIVYAIHENKLAVIMQDTTALESGAVSFDISNPLKVLMEDMRGMNNKLPLVAIASAHTVDPVSEWRDMLGRPFRDM